MNKSINDYIKSELFFKWLTRAWMNFLILTKMIKNPRYIFFFFLCEDFEAVENGKCFNIKVLQLGSVNPVYHFNLHSSGSPFSRLSLALPHLSAGSSHGSSMSRKTLWTQGHMRTFPSSSAMGTCVCARACVCACRHSSTPCWLLPREDLWDVSPL